MIVKVDRDELIVRDSDARWLAEELRVSHARTGLAEFTTREAEAVLGVLRMGARLRTSLADLHD